MYAAKYIFSSKFFYAWVVLSIIWVWGTMIVAGFFPILDGWGQISLVIRGLRGGNKESSEMEEVEAVQEDRGLKGIETREGSDSQEKSEY